jgi:chromate reductase, NAD(P)H dehydrogenase (quinone)
MYDAGRFVQWKNARNHGKNAVKRRRRADAYKRSSRLRGSNAARAYPPSGAMVRSMTADPQRAVFRVLGVCGSLQASSGNRELLQRAGELAPVTLSITLSDHLRALPHFNPDLEQDGVPEAVACWREALAAHDALLITCPEYGFSLPGALKNGIDWAIGSGELERKVVAVTAATVAPYRGLKGLSALRQTLEAVSARIVGGEPIARGDDRDGALVALLTAVREELERPV